MDEEHLERAYLQPDPEFPYPRKIFGPHTGEWMECEDDNQLERWRSINFYETLWMDPDYEFDDV